VENHDVTPQKRMNIVLNKSSYPEATVNMVHQFW